jgi:L-ascorbate metabolism protein UlaG (beta-lactamase superfamily)
VQVVKDASAPLLRVRWLGHSSFLVTAGDGTRWVSDPCDETTGYLPPPVSADFVTVSHPHFDHNAVHLVEGNPLVLDRRGEVQFGPCLVRGVLTYHDDLGGARRGANLAFVVEFGPVRVCHLGDLGHVLNRQQRAELGRVDVLMVPVGGRYTIDAAGAAATVKQLRPAVVLPMHYRTAALAFPLDAVEGFANRMRHVVWCEGSTLDMTAELLQGAPVVHVLRYM